MFTQTNRNIVFLVLLLTLFGCIQPVSKEEVQPSQEKNILVQKNLSEINYSNNSRYNLSYENSSLPVTPKLNLSDFACIDSECVQKSNIDYIIVTRHMFLDSLAEFVAWKKQNGYSVGVLTADWISSYSHDERGLDYSIRNTIQNFANQKRTRFILLVGHTQIGNPYSIDTDFMQPGMEKTANSLNQPWNIPIGYAYAGDEFNRALIYSDLFYVDSNSWYSASQRNERPYCEVDMFNFVAAVGRWPVKTPEEVAIISNKTINFIPKPYSNVLIINSEDLYDYSTDWCFNKRQVYSDQSLNDQFYSNLESQHNFGPKCGLMKALQEHNKQYTILNSRVGNSEPVRNIILNTDFPIFFTAHGSRDGVWFPDGPITVNNTSQFNGTSPLFTSLGSSCNIVHWYANSTTPSLFEYILKLPSAPPIAVGAVPNEYDFATALVEGKSVGEAFTTNRPGSFQCLYYTQLLGDPSIKIFNE